MRVAFDVAQTCAERAGCAWYQASLANALADVMGPGEHLVLYHQFGEWINADTTPGVKPVRASDEAPFLGMAPATARSLWNAIVRGTARLPGNPAVVQSNGFIVPDLRHTGVRQVVVIHDVAIWTHPEFTTEANRILCQRGILDSLSYADAFIFVSDYSRREFERLFPGWLERNNKPYRSILLGTRFEVSRGASARRNDFWYSAGTIEPRKNYDILLEAYAIYRAKSSTPKPLVISGGSGWMSEGIKSRITILEQEGLVRLRGYVSEEEMADLYSNCFGFVFTSWYEGFGLPVLEAMSLGAVVVSSDASSLPEVGSDAALYASPGSAVGFADQMLLLETDSSLRESLREKSLARASSLTWRRCAEETLAFYREILSL